MRFKLTIVQHERTITREGLTKSQLHTWVESWMKDDTAVTISIERTKA